MNAVLVISERDNVASALDAFVSNDAAPPGIYTQPAPVAFTPRFQSALCAIAAGDVVVKYGSPIGRASADIAAGTHVHTHNVASARGRGDLAKAGSR